MAKIRYNELESCNGDSLLSLLDSEELDPPPQKSQNCWIAASPALGTMSSNVLHNDQRKWRCSAVLRRVYSSYLAADSEICVEFT